MKTRMKFLLIAVMWSQVLCAEETPTLNKHLARSLEFCFSYQSYDGDLCEKLRGHVMRAIRRGTDIVDIFKYWNDFIGDDLVNNPGDCLEHLETLMSCGVSYEHLCESNWLKIFLSPMISERRERVVFDKLKIIFKGLVGAANDLSTCLVGWDDRTPLEAFIDTDFAINGGGLVRCLLENGASVCGENSAELVDRLVSTYWDADSDSYCDPSDMKGGSVLHLYTMMGEIDSVRAIYEHSSSEGIRGKLDSKGRNFMHYLASSYEIEKEDDLIALLEVDGIVQYLLAEDSNGKTPVDMARDLGKDHLLTCYQGAIDNQVAFADEFSQHAAAA